MKARSATAASRSARTSSAIASRWPTWTSTNCPGLLDGRLVGARPGLVRFRRSDYLGDPAQPLDEAVRSLVASRCGSRPEGPIRVLTHLRTFGHCFNPVSFYYCFEAGGEQVQSVLAEVTSTPWGERHAYVLPQGDGPVIRGDLEKATARVALHEHGTALHVARSRAGRRPSRCTSRAARTGGSPSTPRSAFDTYRSPGDRSPA